ncbi:MAG: Rpn family recombination-promoting nuclease/putative transposase [Deltaproteobacteria bacterium]|nr:Rpn family recombination-promoting nuclease/putative transposase [Deltaproteobacteria bacterium]
MSSDHDHLFKLVFSHPAEAAALARGVMPPEAVELLRLDALAPLSAESIDDALRVSLSDLLFTAPWLDGGYAQLMLLFEHQSSPDAELPLRALEYTLRVWHLTRAERQRLPVVFTVVIHHGPRPWSVPRRLSELYDAPSAALEAMGPMLPELKLCVLDLAALDDAELPGQGGGRLALLLLRHAHEGKLWDLLGAHMPLWRSLLAEHGEHDAMGLLQYLWRRSDSAPPQALRAAIQASLSPPNQEVFMGYADQLQACRQECWGVEIGERRGEHNGRVAIAVELLTDRFGPLPSWAFEHLQGADNDELRRVLREHLGAPSLASLLERSS